MLKKGGTFWDFGKKHTKIFNILKLRILSFALFFVLNTEAIIREI